MRHPIVDVLNKEGIQEIKAVNLDVTDLLSVWEAKAFIENDKGKLDILINNAGISGKLPQAASNAPIEDIREVFDTNFFGTINVIQTFLPLLRKSGSHKCNVRFIFPNTA